MKIDYSKFFRKDQYGNNVYYPWGIGKGYIVPDKVKYDEILKSLEDLNILPTLTLITSIVTGVIAVILNLNLITSLLIWGIGIFILHYACYRLFVSPKIKNLVPSSDKMKIKNFVIAQACMASFKFYIVFMAISLLLSFIDPTFEKWDVFFLAFFFMFLAMFLIKLKHQKN